MARKPITTYEVTDDLDGKPLPEDTEPVTLVHEGKTYELYLSDKNRDALISTLDRYTANVEPVGAVVPPKRAGTRTRATGNKVDRPGLHEWANANGFETRGVGRVSKTVLDAYDAAH